MTYYKILGDPYVGCSYKYCGLFRSQPILKPECMDPTILRLTERYMDSASSYGVTTQLTADELTLLASWFRNHIDKRYHLVQFSKNPITETNSEYLGIDVAHHAHYSMLGEGLFKNDVLQSAIIFALNDFFRSKLNEYGLFSSESDAQLFKDVLHEWGNLFPGQLEPFEWEIYHIYKICSK